MAETVKQQLLRQAVDRIGKHELAVQLRSPVSLIEAWIEGQATMPDRKFLLLVDLLDSKNEQSG